jgi:hypothetical protein
MTVSVTTSCADADGGVKRPQAAMASAAIPDLMSVVFFIDAVF